ncbi:MAG TPA: hypothetical protein VMB66_02680 [Candidatus Acidoferrales bacterium]|nr:hypothetical protein [Candidatus Acidoferrales bacterium]
MTKFAARFVILILVGSFATSALAQRHHDPLTEAEITQIRDTSWEPGRRLPLYVDFARARLVKMEQMRSDPKAQNRGLQTHDLLDDFQALYDELNDNIDTYVDRHDDIRKPLKIVLDADTEFQSKLRALKDAANVPPQEAAVYEFVLTNAIDSVDSATDDHRKLLADQEEQAKHKRLNKHPSQGTGVAPE